MLWSQTWKSLRIIATGERWRVIDMVGEAKEEFQNKKPF